MSVTGKPPESWVKARRRIQRRDSRERLRAMTRRPLAVIAVAAVLLLGLAVGITAGLKSETIAGRYCQRVFVPSYFSASGWPSVTEAKHMPNTMILNPSTGIGAGTAPNPAFQAAVRQARQAGIMVLGYSSTADGTRPAAQILADVRHYKAWYGVNGIFLDSVNGTSGEFAYYKHLYNYIHRVVPGASVWMNPGVYPLRQYMSVSDVLMVFEGTYGQYRTAAVPSWARDYPADRFANTVYGAVTSSQANSTISLARSRNAGYVFVTNLSGSNPYDALPAYWSSEVTAITAGCAR
jgi:Spherulation-specific family 4